MDTDKKRTLIFGILIGLAIIGSVIYFLWGNVINRGTLKIIADAPFHVEIFGVSQHDCLISPCGIKLKSGPKDLIISKDGARTLIAEADIKLWRTTELSLNFDLLPTVIEIQNIPEEEIIPEYDLVFDGKAQMQKLVGLDDPTKTGIVYFPQTLDEYTIVHGKNAVLVIDDSKPEGEGYIVNVKDNTREKIENSDIINFEDGKWSPDGKYMVFKKNDSTYLWILNAEDKEIEQLSLATGLDMTSWIYNNYLIFISNQAYSSENDVEITLLAQEALTGYTFGIYNPERNIIGKIGNFAEIIRMPEKFISTASGEAVYFQIDGKKYKINLKNF